MFIGVRVVALMNPEEADRLAEINGAVERDGAVIARFPGKTFFPVCEFARSAKSTMCSTVFWFESSDAPNARFFELRSSRVISLRRGEDDLNFYLFRNIQRTKTGVANGVALRRYLVATDAKEKAGALVGIDQWSSDLACGPNVKSQCEAARLTGIKFIPSYSQRLRGSREDFFLLYSGHILPPSYLDESSLQIPGGSWVRQKRGGLVYEPEMLSGAVDFNRTAEPWHSIGCPLWVVSQRVKTVLGNGQAIGPTFDPVLETGTSDYEHYRSLWSEYLAAISSVKGLKVF